MTATICSVAMVFMGIRFKKCKLDAKVVFAMPDWPEQRPV